MTELRIDLWLLKRRELTLTNNILLLDCTMRDGGQALEVAETDKYSNQFDKEEIVEMCSLFSKSKIDIVELGSIDRVNENKEKYCTYYDIETVSLNIPDCNNNQMYIALYRGPDTDIEDIPEYREGLVEGVRVIIRYSELEKSLDFCASLSKKGYKVFIQPMVTARYSTEQLEYLLERANQMNAYAVYIVDSYGYMLDDDVIAYYDFFEKRLNKDIFIGFHAHNNMDMAVANALAFIKHADEDRHIIIDSTALGMGQGAGNLQTEIIARYLNGQLDRDYQMDIILQICEKVERHNLNEMWGYSLTKFVPTIYKTAYKYAVELKNHYGKRISEIDKILAAMPDEFRHRYTKENVRTLMGLDLKDGNL